MSDLIPLSASEVASYTPPSLANLPTPPVFLVRPVTGRDARAFRRACMVEGLMHHQFDEIRAEMLRGLKRHWSEEDYEAGKAKVQAIWDALDQGLEVDPDDLEALSHLQSTVGRLHKPLATMGADNQDFNDLAPRIALTLFVVGWRHIDVPYRREAGLVPVETVDALEAAVLKIEQAAEADKVEGVKPGVAFVQLWAHVLTAMNLTPGEKQDFPSPSSSASTPIASTTAGPETTNGSSGPAPIVKTRRASSRKTSAT